MHAGRRILGFGLNARRQSAFTLNHRPLDVSTSSPTPSLSLTASHAVRLSLSAGNIADAFRVVNAVRVGRFDSGGGPLLAFALSSSTNNTTITNSTDTTGNSNAGRLPTHTLLHGLIKLNKPKEAASLAEQMMKVGMRVRGRSLEGVFSLLGSTALQSNSGSGSVPQQASSLNIPHSNAHPNVHHNHHHLTLAQALLQTARQTRTRRTHRMIKTLLALALLNGEIVLASLLFGGLVREWRGRMVGDEDNGNGQVEVEDRKNVKDLLPLQGPPAPYPAWSHLAEICGYIEDSVEAHYRRRRPLVPFRSSSHLTMHDRRILKPPDGDDPLEHDQDDLEQAWMCQKFRFSESIQALVNVVDVLLDGAGAEGHRRDVPFIPFGGLAGLIKVLCRCLGVLDATRAESRRRREDNNSRDEPERVWIGDHKTGQMRHVEAERYLRGVMRRFVARLPRSSPSESRTVPQTRELTQRTYNALLFYALVHAKSKLSREMADRVLESMMMVIAKGPNGVTMNIVEGEIKRGRGRGKDEKQERKRWVEKWKARFDDATRGQGQVVVQDPPPPALSVSGLVEASNVDGYALSTRIGMCVASGRPDIVAEAVPHLLPGIITPPSSSKEQQTKTVAVMRAVRYGPVVMTSMLSALMKAGKTGLAERVWKVAREAESVSWEYCLQHGGDAVVVRPWCLGIEAYTVMIQAYAKESRKAVRGRDLVVGWGMRKRRRRRRVGVGRAEMGRYMGMKTFRLVGEKAEGELQLQKRLMALEDAVVGAADPNKPIKVVIEPKHLRPPIPDAPFFNAILDIFARSPPASSGLIIRPRSTRCLTRKKARTRFLGRVRRYVWEGRVMGYYTEPDPGLREVVKKMRVCGFGERVPLLVRRILVGRGEGVESGGVGGGEGAVWVR